MTDTESTTAVATTQQPKTVVPLVGPLADLDQSWRLAQSLALASILPDDLRGKPANVHLVILYGQQLGVPPVVAIQTITVIKGRPVISGKLLLSKVREAGHDAEVTNHTDTSCTVTITRGDTGKSHSETFTLDDAAAAGLVQIKDGKPFARSSKGEKLPWESWTKRMLLWRAAGFCADFICPEVRLHGTFAIEGELDSGPEDDRPTLAQVAAEREDAKPDTVPPAPETEDAEIAEAVAVIARDHGATDDAEPDEEAIRLFAMRGVEDGEA